MQSIQRCQSSVSIGCLETLLVNKFEDEMSVDRDGGKFWGKALDSVLSFLSTEDDTAANDAELESFLPVI